MQAFSRRIRIWIFATAALEMTLLGACRGTSSTHPDTQKRSTTDEKQADVYIRVNHLGYSPSRSKRAVVLSRSDLEGKAWRVTRGVQEALRGVFEASLVGKTAHTPFEYQFELDASAITEPGDYEIQVEGAAPQRLRIRSPRFDELARDMLPHIRMERSGSDDSLHHRKSHPGDAKALVYRPKNGDVASGLWERDPEQATVDALGGWYDAGDYIKFTITNAYTTYYLLRAYASAPEIWGDASALEKPAILKEAQFGLDYLAKMMPSENAFIIQVGNGEDHNEGARLPENDNLDGKRPAYTALSAPQMGSTAAALALGAATFRRLGDEAAASTYARWAKTIFSRATKPDVSINGAFEMNDANEFYHDEDGTENLGLAATELFHLTGDENYRTQAIELLQKAKTSGGASWNSLHIDANYRARDFAPQLRQNFETELAQFQSFDRDAGNIWGIPMPQIWGPVANAFAAGAYAGLATLELGSNDASLAWDYFDYVGGRNNWGVCMIALAGEEHCVQRVYNTIYTLTETFPQGALAEGPGSKAVFEGVKQWIEPSPLDEARAPFNTSTTYFSDNPNNFQTMETVTYGQAAGAFYFAVMHRLANEAREPVKTPESAATAAQPG